jgi:hypothetical protein
VYRRALDRVYKSDPTQPEYLYREDVDGVARAVGGETIGRPGDTPWGMYEFALNRSDETLVRRPACVERLEPERRKGANDPQGL